MNKIIYKGNLTVEMALLFPLLFLLFIGVLRCLFHLGGRLIIQSVCGRCVIIGQEFDRQGEESWQQEAGRAAGQYVNRSAMPVGMKALTVNQDAGIFFRKCSVQISAYHQIWGKAQFEEAAAGYIVNGASLRNIADFTWEAAERIPGIGNVIQEYEQKLDDFKKALSG